MCPNITNGRQAQGDKMPRPHVGEITVNMRWLICFFDQHGNLKCRRHGGEMFFKIPEMKRSRDESEVFFGAWSMGVFSVGWA